MYQKFPLFRSPLDLAHHYWQAAIQSGDWVIDATCGNGHDSLKLSALVKRDGGLIAMDIQEKAIEQTRSLLGDDVHLFHQSHTQWPPLAYQHPIGIIVYNLGYLPGGDKSLTTQTASTLLSIDTALPLLREGGILSVTCYPGHEEGAREQKAILDKYSQLTPAEWCLCHHIFPNRTASPSLLLIQKTFK